MASPPKVQHVVEERMQHLEETVMKKVTSLLHDLRTDIQTQIVSNQQQQSQGGDHQQEVRDLIEQFRQEHQGTLDELRARQDTIEQTMGDYIQTLRDQQSATQAQLNENASQLSSVASQLQRLNQQQSDMEQRILPAISAQASPPRKKRADEEQL